MITVLALDRHDGWVFAIEGDRIVLLRPPYHLNEAQVVSETAVARGVNHYGYLACERELSTWAEVIAFVRGEVARQREAEGRPIPDKSVGRTFLRSAPASTVERFLERIQAELMPREEFNDAEEILRVMQIESPCLLESAELARRTAKLLEEVLRKKEARFERHVREDDRFPRLARKGRLAHARIYSGQIERAGSMFVQQGSGA